MHSLISIAVPTRHRIPVIESFINNVVSTTPNDRIPDIYIAHDCPDNIKDVDVINEKLGIHGFSSYLPVKSSLTQLWNYLIMYTPTDWVLICNDDIVLNKGWLGYLEKTIAKNKYKQIHLISYGGFCIHKSLIPAIGWFDERFPSGGFEDYDWELRLSEAGLTHMIDRSQNTKIAKHLRHESARWDGNANRPWTIKKWGRDNEWYKDFIRQEKEIDWHPKFTQMYMEKYNCNSITKNSPITGFVVKTI